MQVRCRTLTFTLRTNCKHVARRHDKCSSKPWQTCCRDLAEHMQKTHPRRALTTAMHERVPWHVHCEIMACALRNKCKSVARIQVGRGKVTSKPWHTRCRNIAKIMQKTHPPRALTTAMHEWKHWHVRCEIMACALRNKCKPVAGIQVGRSKVNSKPWHTRCRDQVNQLRKRSVADPDLH
jgi:hypothetical protein